MHKSAVAAVVVAAALVVAWIAKTRSPKAPFCPCCPRWIEDFAHARFTPNPHPSTPCNRPGRVLLGVPFRVTDEL